MQTLCSGLGLVESPRWHAGRIWFSDWTAGRIHAVDPDGTDEVVLEHASLPLCFDFLPDGRLVVVSNQHVALLTHEDGALHPYADLSAFAAGFNDIVIDARGNAYVNSPNFDFASGPPPGAVQPGLVVLVTPDGRSEVVATDLAFPNGMAVTEDGATLLVADSYRHQLVGFDVAGDGTLSARRVWAELGDAAPDGICIDAEGAAWYADVPHRRCVRVAEGGTVLDEVPLDRGAFACMLDRERPASLHITAARWPGAAALGSHVDWDGQLLRVPAPAAGAGRPGDGPA